VSFSKPITRPERSFIGTTSSPVSSDTYSDEGSVNQARQRLLFPVVENLHFGHIRTPSLMASVGYAVIKNAPSAARFAITHVQRLVVSAL
jgi:hypothetical protein